jgi:tRNA (guanine37-N1)-methyltransferase
MIELLPCELKMDYDNWSYDDLVKAILPPEVTQEGTDIPGAFSQTGHIAHLNLRTQFNPYKHILAQLILDKCPKIETVVNKLDDVGAASIYRTFPMEILAGREDTVVEVRATDCRFSFDFAKVYWNSRLNHEHERMTAAFKPGQAIADVMAGVGPFAMPSGKKGCLVWANDLNPDSFESLRANIVKNKLQYFVTAFNQDGRVFIREAIRDLYKLHCSPKDNPIVIPPPQIKYKVLEKDKKPAPEPTYIRLPATFSHFVMNLPATAVEFLDAYRGCYLGLEKPFMEGQFQMPMVHVYTFHRETADSPLEDAGRAICEEISKSLGYRMTNETVDIHDVRRVAPNKGMYCASFRLPQEVAFGDPKEPEPEDPAEARRKEDVKNWEKWVRHDEKPSTAS